MRSLYAMTRHSKVDSTRGLENSSMASKKIFIEQRDDGQYTVTRQGAKRASAVEPTQAMAIDRAREIEPSVRPDVERVRNTSVGHRDQWRKA